MNKANYGMSEKNWQDEYLAMVQDCERRFGLLNEWEQSFVSSLRIQMDNPGFVISPKQTEKLEAIWENVVNSQPSARGQRGKR
jgi:hypothetical protein